MRKLVTGWRPLLALACIVAVAWIALCGLPDGKLHVWFLDVGQGDAILIETPEGHQILIDGGPSPSALAAELGAVMPFWDRSLDLVVMTHPDSDHAAGLIPVFERYTVAAALDGVADGDSSAAAWIDATAMVRRQTAMRGALIVAGGARLAVLHPAFPQGVSEISNDDSVVLRLEYGATSVLLTGDAQEAAEEELLASGLPLRADVLKVAHHGSNGSTSARFLSDVQPRMAVISVGPENRFGHPAPELLERLQGIDILRTDQRGRIELVSDGKGWTARCER
jgi:competence protein ComEC